MRSPGKPTRAALGAALLTVLAVIVAWPPEAETARPSWDQLIAPHAVGGEVALGFRLSPGRRGSEHDVVFTAHRAKDAQRIEIHILDRGRWAGARETRSFGVDYEEPHSTANVEEVKVVVEALARAIAEHDRGDLGTVDSIPLRATEDTPLLARVFADLSVAEAAIIGLCSLLVSWCLIALPRGPLWLAGFLFVVGGALRVCHLDGAFVWDQDVQRAWSGALPMVEILAGEGLNDRHPPLYFLLLHFVQAFGQSEAVLRFPAALAGTLAGPGIVWAVRVHDRHLGLLTTCGALIATLSPPLIAASREVSDLPLFAVIVIAMIALTTLPTPKRRHLVAITLCHALALWTYYLAGFVIVAELTVLGALCQLNRRKAKWITAGVAMGIPSLVLGARTYWRDLDTRTAAATFPESAWGDRGPWDMSGELVTLTVQSMGWFVPILIIIATALSLRRRDGLGVIAAVATLATGIAIACLTPFARMQPYYLLCVLPVALLSLSTLDTGLPRRASMVAALVACLATATFTAGYITGLQHIYGERADAFMDDFASVILQGDERRVLTVAQYDAKLLCYYLARGAGIRFDSAHISIQPEEIRFDGLDIVVEPMVLSHGMDRSSDANAVAALQPEALQEPVLVVVRDQFRLPLVEQHLSSSCELVAERPNGRLFRCSPVG